MSGKTKKFDWRLPLLSLASFAVALCICEGAARELLRKNWTEPAAARGLYLPGAFPGERHVLTPHFNGVHIRRRVRTNSKGMRGAEVSYRKDPDEFRILALGDSFTFGYGVEDEETWPARLEKALMKEGERQGRRFRVINAGVDGYNMFDEVLCYERRGRLFAPDAVVLYHVEDDLFKPDDPRFRKVEDWFRIDNPAHEWLAPRSWLYNFFVKRRQFAYYSRDREDNYMRLLRDAYRKDSRYWKEFEREFRRLKRMTDEDGAFLIQAVYALYEGDPKIGLLEKNAANAGVGFVKLFTNLKADPSLWVEPYWPHPSGKMNAMVAEKIKRYMEGKGLLNGKPTEGKPFKTWDFFRVSHRNEWRNASGHLKFSEGARGLNFISTGPDPFMLNPRVDLASGIGAIEIELAITADKPGSGKIYWSEDGPENFDERRTALFDVSGDGLDRAVTAYSPVWASWEQGKTIRGLRIDPMETEGTGVIRKVAVIFNGN